MPVPCRAPAVRPPPPRLRPDGRTSRPVALAALCLVTLLVGPRRAPAQTLAFVEATDAAGLTSVHSPPPGLATSPMLSGGAATDFDRDGLQDLYVVMGGALPDRLFLNDGDGTFTDAAAGWGADVAHVGGGCAVGDYDADGWPDLFVASHGTAAGLAPGGHVLHHNEGGAGFTDQAARAGVAWASPTMGDGYGAAFGDADRDGDLDLFVTSWQTGADGNRLFRNDGDGTFTDVTGTAIPAGLDDVHGFSPRFVDMDGDLWPELLLAADFGTSRYLANAGDGTFLDMTPASGTGLDSNGMGQAVGDLDGDGRLDWYVTSILADGDQETSGNMLYLATGPHAFEEISVAAGVNDGGWGWGVVAEDFDQDGHLDLAETNGWTTAEFVGEPSYLFLGDGDGTFTEAGTATGFVHLDQGRGLLAFDGDADGDRDLVVFAIAGPLRYFRNDVSGPDAHHLVVRLDAGGAAGIPPDGHGARVEVTAGGRTQVRPLCGGSAYLTAGPLEVHVGLGAATSADEVAVTWTDGTRRELAGVAADQVLEVTCCAGWLDLGGGLAGAAGIPSLSGSGTLEPGDPVSLALDGAAPGAAGWLVVGLTAASVAFKGGELVPSLDVLLPWPVDGSGSAQLTDAWPAGVPAGTRTWLQAWIADASGPAGFAASGALRLTTP